MTGERGREGEHAAEGGKLGVDQQNGNIEGEADIGHDGA